MSKCVLIQCLPNILCNTEKSSLHKDSITKSSLNDTTDYEEEIIEVFKAISNEKMYRELVKQTSSELDKIPPINIFLYKSYSEKNNEYSINYRYYRYVLRKKDVLVDINLENETKKNV